MLMCEVKISKEQFDYLNAVWYVDKKKTRYIENILNNKYEYSEDATFFTYKDSRNYYLVFEGEKKISNKIHPSLITDNQIKN